VHVLNMVFAQLGCVFALFSISDGSAVVCGPTSATNAWTGTCATGSTLNDEACTPAGDADQPACGVAACCGRTCSAASFQVTTCDAGKKLVTGTAWTTTICDTISTGLNPEVGWANGCDQSLCCEAGTGSTCGHVSTGATTPGFCGSSKMYDSTKTANMCKALSSGACVEKDASDVHACCKATAGQKCSASDFATSFGICPAGESYKTTLANNLCSATLPLTCDTSNGDDLNTCCSVNTGEKCSVAATVDGWCPAGYSYDTTKANKKCKGDCDPADLDDQVACCSKSQGEKCSVGKAGSVDGWCPAGMTYETARASNQCKAKTTAGGCSATIKDDQNACCTKTKGTVACKTFFLDDGLCSASRPGYQYNKDAADNLCVSSCASDKLTDTNTCCKASVGQSCEAAGISQGWCPAGHFYDEKKKKNKCVDIDACDASNANDVNACCSPLAGAARCGDMVDGFMSKGMCGSGMSYNEESVSKKCAGAKCASANKDDVKQCCKANEGEGTCGKVDPSFCGVGKSLDPEKSDSKCTGKTCSLSNADDILTCCKDNEGAACNDEKKGAKGAGFCGLGYTFDLATSNNCKGDSCVSGDPVDLLSCCKANAGEACSKIVATSTFCGSGKVLDLGKAADLCASATCSSSSSEDVITCCKTAPPATTATVGTTKNSSTPGTTGSAQANSVCTVTAVLGIFALVIN